MLIEIKSGFAVPDAFARLRLPARLVHDHGGGFQIIPYPSARSRLAWNSACS
jgi:hypothetical protein